MFNFSLGGVCPLRPSTQPGNTLNAVTVKAASRTKARRETLRRLGFAFMVVI
jgi:hypothetical protein